MAVIPDSDLVSMPDMKNPSQKSALPEIHTPRWKMNFVKRE
jgi:hypothetical protein